MWLWLMTVIDWRHACLAVHVMYQKLHGLATALEAEHVLDNSCP